MRTPIQNQNGIALIIALMLTLMLTIVGLGIITSSNDEITIAGNELNEMRAFYIAESGLDIAAARIQTHYEATGVPPASMPSDTAMIDGIMLGFSTVQDAMSQRQLTKGTLGGLKAYVRPHRIVSTAYDSSHNTTVTLEQSFEVAFVPIFQFGIFYENDLEIAPSPPMQLIGRIHSNGDIYLQSDINLQIESYLSSYGSIYHGRKPGSGLATSEGDVLIEGMDRNLYSMKDGGDWLDANDAHWFDTASVRWGGRVQDSTFGQDKLSLPLSTPTDVTHTIIEPAAGGANPNSFENKAGFKIINGQAFYDVGGGTWVDVTAPLVTSGALTETTFRDMRENKNITVVDIDMSLFKGSPYFPSNGIVYISDQRAGMRGARLNNADEIGVPLTIACGNPLYTKGDVNTKFKSPVSIIADALTILSANWNDAPAVAGSNNKADRPAIATEVNFSFITGNTETGVGGAGYNGGVENLPRFLEDWSSKTCKFRGSIVNLWYSSIATGNWSESYYTPPNRDWAYDTVLDDPANMPPGTPMVRAFIRWGWRQADVGYVASEFGTVPDAQF